VGKGVQEERPLLQEERGMERLRKKESMRSADGSRASHIAEIIRGARDAIAATVGVGLFLLLGVKSTHSFVCALTCSVMFPVTCIGILGLKHLSRAPLVASKPQASGSIFIRNLKFYWTILTGLMLFALTPVFGKPIEFSEDSLLALIGSIIFAYVGFSPLLQNLKVRGKSYLQGIVAGEAIIYGLMLIYLAIGFNFTVAAPYNVRLAARLLIMINGLLQGIIFASGLLNLIDNVKSSLTAIKQVEYYSFLTGVLFYDIAAQMGYLELAASTFTLIFGIEYCYALPLLALLILALYFFIYGKEYCFCRVALVAFAEFIIAAFVNLLKYLFDPSIEKYFEVAGLLGGSLQYIAMYVSIFKYLRGGYYERD